MFASFRRYRLDSGEMDEALHRVDEHLCPRLAEEPGFVAYQCVQVAEDEVISLSCFRDRQGAERSVELAAEFVADHLSDMEVSRVDARMGEVMVSRAENEVLQPAHH
jgi:hypothetical protein